MAEVKVYSTNSCPYCVQLKSYLDENEIQYENIDVGVDKQAAQEMIDKSGQMGVPVVDIDGEIIVGFKRDIIAGKLGI